MSYDKQSIIPVLDVKTGFNKAAKEYRQYRPHLDSVDNNKFLRFLPRSLNNLTILDLGSGDGRIFSHFKNVGYREYIALDVAQEMLDRFQSSAVKKICTDCEEGLPFEDSSLDLICMFFVLEYITDIDFLFSEIARVLKPGAVCVASYFHQRNAFVFSHGEDSFKVERFPHTYDEVKAAAEYSFLQVDELPLSGEGRVTGYIYEFKKG